MGKLDGKVAVITGGTSGMALAAAQLFVQEGAHVFVTGRRRGALDEAVGLIGQNVTGVQGDVSSLDDLDRLFDTVKRERGAIDVLYASAGTSAGGLLGEVPVEDFDSLFDVNVRGTFFTVQKALPLLNDDASVIMTGSVASVKGFAGISAYSGSKAALLGFARVWLSELRDRRIRFNVISPGQVATAVQDGADEELKGQMEAMIPRGFMGRSEEIASVALFLASDDSSYVNGQDLVVDGGLSAI